MSMLTQSFADKKRKKGGVGVKKRSKETEDKEVNVFVGIKSQSSACILFMIMSAKKHETRRSFERDTLMLQ